ncbi:molybdopterin oxidoreductase family protein [Clostridium tertium]|jgi:anaerobic selenocysteine-containing dehydrogenase|uniref:molybdopterin oxidoreductase family protein n=3 Tax=Clostridiaceae TaxID=31979 RepID=UPI001157DA0C|nr:MULTISPECIES: molybdopterin oxidoreductase family protein [Clostridium]MDB1923932.1 molybdopterin oxidoreductase family protein [Clostridium tertium]MDB1927063.1 molybdopterin oxidoreductase family protein [Clostridium tertium]MDB1930775.1 molybdopterin oxidoreductase family protein [Clostridium tertium]MDU3523924.1 molybdopterin oxidoreductase family protein [Clostridium sp.]MDU3546948.1 molybdopterin oxidoreductase family protein [Clostridium sp.]
MKVVRSTCNYCSIACNFDFHVEDDGFIQRVKPAKDYPVNRGFCCVKGLNLDKQNTIYENPVLPLLRNEKGELEHISWDKAFNIFAERVKKIQDEYGKESFAFLSTGQLCTEEMALAGHIGRTFLGGNGDGNTRLCMATAVVAYKQSFGFDSPPYTFEDLELSDVMIFIGCNPVVAHPILWSRVIKNRNKDKKIITIDPRRSETVTNSDIWIDLKPKSDLRLLYTLSNVLIEKGWIDEEFIKNSTEDFEGFKNHVKKYDVNDVEEYTGISKGRVLELAKIIHEGKRVSFWWTMGVNQGYQAVRTAQAVINLALMTGNIGRPGTGANSITGQCNAMGSRLFSNTTGLYGGGEYTDKARRKVVAKALGIDEEMLPKKPTIPYNAIIEGINNGTIKALWVLATNPVVSWINSLEFKKAAEKLEFLAVQDIYSDTETCKYAHLILPSTNGLKKEGVLINTERRLSKIQPVLEKKKDELSDYDILLGIGNALGMGSLLDKWKTPKDAFEVLKECTRNMPCDITGVSYDMLKDSKGIQWPFKEGDDIEKEERRLFEDKKFYTQNKKAKFIYEDIMSPPFEQNEEYPYILNTGRGTVGQWHTQTRTREIPDVEAIIMKEGYINLNTDLAEELDIRENDMVKLSSPNGVSNKFLVKLSRTVKKDQLYAPMHYIEANSVLPSIFDTYSKEPNYKYGPVKIEKIN